MKPPDFRLGLTFVALVGVILLGGCVDEDIVYVERPLFDDPPSQAAGFVGYSDQEAKRTVCGACHVGQQGRWEQTGHADAWVTLAATGDTRAFCEACHTVSERGNEIEGDAGWVATGNPRYHDVQCESCHGPGLDHVTTPDAPGNQPLATLSLGPNTDMGCAECHSGVHRPFAEEWAASGHGDMNPSPQGRAGCQDCHEGKGALQAWGVKSIFSPEDQANTLAITCAVCHDPHDARHEGQLRFAVDAPSVEQNLCMKCHNQRGSPTWGVSGAPTRRKAPPPRARRAGGSRTWSTPPGDILGSHGTEANRSPLCRLPRHRLPDDRPRDRRLHLPDYGALLRGDPLRGPGRDSHRRKRLRPPGALFRKLHRRVSQ
jgi:predicted CXXCH cytochrome family protein